MLRETEASAEAVVTEEDLPARVVGRGVRADPLEAQRVHVPRGAHIHVAHREAEVVNVFDHPHPSLRRTSAVIRWRQVARCDQSASVPELNFDERIATRYETYWPNLFDPAVVEPGRRLPRRARRWRRARVRNRHRSPRTAPPRAGARARDRTVTGDGGATGDEAGCGRHRRDDRRLRARDGRRDLHARLPRSQHDHEPDDAGRTGRVLPQRRRASRGPAVASSSR